MAHGGSVEVREYYEVNTQAFRKLGHGRATGAIRRAVWGPGVHTRGAAFAYVDGRIAGELSATAERLALAGAPRVLDFGCGLGASLIALAERAPLEGLGVTLSPLQAQLANGQIAARGLGAQLRCFDGDYLRLDPDLPLAHLVLAIESFVHSPSPEAFFQAAARRLAPGGCLVVCDDFEREPTSARSAEELRCLHDFRHGWVAPSVVPWSRAQLAAAQAGLACQSSECLNAFLELDRPRDRALAWLVKLARPWQPRSYRFRSWLGGCALQQGLRSGLIEYRYSVWIKPDVAAQDAAQ
jgi:tocopherol O-methyltransferase